MDKVGDTTDAEGVSGGVGGEEATTTLLLLLLLPAPWAWAWTWAMALSCAKTSQNALCVMKLSLLENKVPQSQRYSRVPQVFMCAFQSE